MSKSTPIRPDEAQRSTKVENPESVPHVKEPAAPPVEMMYLMPEDESVGRFAVAIAAPCTPAQFSLPHSPVANASVIALPPAATRSLPRGVAEPLTVVVIAF